jgi:hypothetical protein
MYYVYVQETNIAVKNSSCDENSESRNTDSIWVEGLVPGIDFCNHSKSPNPKRMNELNLSISWQNVLKYIQYFYKNTLVHVCKHLHKFTSGEN